MVSARYRAACYKFNIKEFSLKNLFNIKSGQEFLFKFLEKTQILIKNWLLKQANLKVKDEE